MKPAAYQKVVVVCLALASLAWAAPPRFSAQKRVGLATGDQWEPAVAADGAGHLYVLYPHYGRVPECKDCRIPTMLLLVSSDNGKTWQAQRVMLESGSAQYDAQIVVDPADRRTVYAAWLQSGKRAVMVAKSVDSGATWAYAIAVRSAVELDKPALAVRGQNIYVGFNHEEDVWVTVSQDAGRSFTSTRVNAENRPGWSLLALRRLMQLVTHMWRGPPIRKRVARGAWCISTLPGLRTGARRGALACSTFPRLRPAVKPRNAARLIWERKWRSLAMRVGLCMRSGARAI